VQPESALLPQREERLIRALASEDGNAELRDYLRSVLAAEPLYVGLRSEPLIRKLLEADVHDLASLSLSSSEQAQLAAALMPPKILYREELTQGAVDDTL